MKKRNKHVGSSLNDFLKEEGILEETRTLAIKEAVAGQVQQAMEKGYPMGIGRPPAAPPFHED